MQECVDDLNAVNGHGDTKEMNNIVKQLEGKPGKPPKNLISDGHGNLLVDASAVAKRWFVFLKKKFMPTVVGFRV